MNQKFLHRLRISSADLIGIGALTALCLAFFWRMAFTDLILPRGDTFAYFYPYWAYRDAALAAGKIPLWNPYLFMGAPFLANSQAGVLYPLNWPLSWLYAPNAIKVASVLHIVLGAWGMYFLARQPLKLSVLGAVFAGALFALGGYVTSQVEHVNQLQGLAWMPWLFWLWDETLHKTHRATPYWFALVLAMQLLAGHSQTAFITVVGLLIWTGWHIIGKWIEMRRADPAKARSPRALLQLGLPLAILAACGIAAAGLAAAQLLPTLELTRLSNRSGGLPLLEALSFSLRPYLIGRAMLPQYTTPSLFSEYVGYIGVTGLILAVIGAWSSRKMWRWLGVSALGAAALFLALGAYNPVYWGLVKVVPGFGLFRAPARWLALWALASAGLAGMGLDWLRSEAGRITGRTRLTAAAAGIVAALVGLTFAATLAGNEVPGATRPPIGELAAWMVTGAAAIGLVVWMARSGSGLTRHAPTALAAIGLVELFLASQIQPYNQLTTPEAWSGQRPAISTILADNNATTPPARFLSLSDILFDPGDLHEIQASYAPYLSESQIYDYVITTKEKEILAPNLPLYWRIPAMDGFDGGILPTRDYTRFSALFVDADRVSPDGRLRENLKTVPDLHWLQIANVRWLITDKVFDAWLDGIYYDLQFTERRDSGSAAAAIEAYPAEAFVATELGLIGHVETAKALPDGTPIGTLRVEPGAGSSEKAIEIALVVDGRQPGAIGVKGADAPSEAGKFTPGQPDLAEYRTMASWAEPTDAARVTVTLEPAFNGALVVRGITLIDGRTGAFSSTTLSENHCMSMANSGDVKVYRYDCALPRAVMACPTVVATADEAWNAVKQIPMGGKQVVEDAGAGQSECKSADAESATVADYEPERIAIRAQAGDEGRYLILSDAWYPGWEATVDGKPAEVLRADGLFRAVKLPAGDHEVVFTYRSRPFEIGLVISGVCLLGVIAGLCLPLVRRRRTPTD